MLKFMSAVFIFATIVQTVVAQPKDTIFYQDVSWSPDGTKLLLSRLDISGDIYLHCIYSVNSDGTNFQKITDGPDDVWTSWAPDGSKFVYASKKNNNTDICLRYLESDSVVRLTSDSTRDSHPDWSPDGSRIAFVSRKNGKSQIYLKDTSGSNLSMLTGDSVSKENPRWSPDGKRIAYYGNVEAGHDSIYIIDADGKNKFTLCQGVWPSWSPDGNRIIFTYNDVIYKIKIDDTVKTKIIDNAYFARWSPDAKKLAFIRRMWKAEKGWPVKSAVFIINADGTSERRLTPE